MILKVADICQKMETIAPLHLAESWDNVGLMLGHYDWPVKKILLALDLSTEVVSQAVAQKVDLIITHHPLIFKPLKNLVFDNEKNQIIYELVRAKIAVYSAHTNLDATVNGVSDVLAEHLGLMDIKPLTMSELMSFFKLVTFVPEAHRTAVLAALHAAGAGNIGEYSECAYFSDGLGQFKPGNNSNPFIGQLNKLETTRETRIEVILPKNELKSVVTSLLAVHPYETPAYEINEVYSGSVLGGLGRVGELKRETSLRKFTQQVKSNLKLQKVVFVDAGKNVKKVAVCGGSGTDLLHDAVRAGADTFVTGDVKYHVAQEAVALGINLIDASHQMSELPMMEVLRENLTAWSVQQSHELNITCAEEKELLQQV